MRIIAGRFRGRRLVHFKADHIRPTTDRVKESVFNKLQAKIDGARVLDLYSGTGNLACEAVSRGAVHVDLVELSKKSIQIVRENLRLLDIEKEVDLHIDDVLKYLKRYQGEPYDLIFADPPFTEKLADATLLALSLSQALGPETIVMVEASSHEHVAESYPDLERVDHRDYGDKQVTYWRKPSRNPLEDSVDSK